MTPNEIYLVELFDEYLLADRNFEEIPINRQEELLEKLREVKRELASKNDLPKILSATFFDFAQVPIAWTNSTDKEMIERKNDFWMRVWEEVNDIYWG